MGGETDVKNPLCKRFERAAAIVHLFTSPLDGPICNFFCMRRELRTQNAKCPEEEEEGKRVDRKQPPKVHEFGMTLKIENILYEKS